MGSVKRVTLASGTIHRNMVVKANFSDYMNAEAILLRSECISCPRSRRNCSCLAYRM